MSVEWTTKTIPGFNGPIKMDLYTPEHIVDPTPVLCNLGYASARLPRKTKVMGAIDKAERIVAYILHSRDGLSWRSRPNLEAEFTRRAEDNYAVANALKAPQYDGQGISMGALDILATGREFPGIFRKIAAITPAIKGRDLGVLLVARWGRGFVKGALDLLRKGDFRTFLESGQESAEFFGYNTLQAARMAFEIASIDSQALIHANLENNTQLAFAFAGEDKLYNPQDGLATVQRAVDQIDYTRKRGGILVGIVEGVGHEFGTNPDKTTPLSLDLLGRLSIPQPSLLSATGGLANRMQLSPQVWLR